MVIKAISGFIELFNRNQNVQASSHHPKRLKLGTAAHSCLSNKLGRANVFPLVRECGQPRQQWNQLVIGIWFRNRGHCNWTTTQSMIQQQNGIHRLARQDQSGLAKERTGLHWRCDHIRSSQISIGGQGT